jgi:hypothetical protein
MTNKKDSFGKIFMKHLFGNLKILTLCTPLYVISGVTNFFGEYIETQRQLDDLIRIESGKLGLNSNYITGKLCQIPDSLAEKYAGGSNLHSACVYKLDEKDYKIILENSRTNNALRHELYHIYDNDFNVDGKYNVLELLTNEFQANIYAATGIKTSINHLKKSE